MEAELFTVCDYAADMGNGKLVIVGMFDNITVEKFPTIHPALSVVVKVLFKRGEAGKHDVKVAIADPTGAIVLPPGPGEVLVEVPEGRDSIAMNLIVGVGQLKLGKAGRYEVSLRIDGQNLRTVFFTAREK
jgi:hypothetical protein